MRIEKDFLGEVSMTDETVYGINTIRGHMHFPFSVEPINPYFLKAFLYVKKAATETNYKCGLLFKEKYELIDEAIDELIDETEKAILHDDRGIYDKIIITPFHGGAGTSFNMNVNEVIANTALKISGKKAGDYPFIHPLDDVNMSQSTNDTYITALNISAIFLLRELVPAIEKLHLQLLNKSQEFIKILKLGRAEYQDAVPISLGQEFAAYAKAIGRDIQRLKNSEASLYQVNLGGTAVGNSVNATKEYVKNVNQLLQEIIKLPVEKGADLIDLTQNLDILLSVHSNIRTHAVTIIKICNDILFMSSGPKGGIGEISLPQLQSGSSIMPGKVSPVALEYSIQIAETIKGHDLIMANLISQGNLELNPFITLIGHLLLKSFQMMKEVDKVLTEKCIAGIKADAEKCHRHLIESSAIAASLISAYGYETIQHIVTYAEKHKIPFVKALIKSKIVDENELYVLLSRELGIDVS